MNEETELDQISDVDTEQGPIEGVMREEIMEAFKHLKIGKTPGPSEVYVETILASGDVGVSVLMEPSSRILVGKRMPAEWETGDAIPMFKGKGDIMNCGVSVL